MSKRAADPPRVVILRHRGYLHPSMKKDSSFVDMVLNAPLTEPGSPQVKVRRSVVYGYSLGDCIRRDLLGDKYTERKPSSKQWRDMLGGKDIVVKHTESTESSSASPRRIIEVVASDADTVLGDIVRDGGVAAPVA